MEIKKTSELVKGLLESTPSNRDCDKKLIANVLFLQAKAKGLDPKEISMMDFLQEFVQGDTFVNPESIRRARARLQELHQELRGSNYKYRNNHSKEKVIKEIKQI